MSSKRVTVYDIAEKLGVSHAKVSLALRNHPSISEKRREQVKKKAAEMGYVPDPHLAALAAHRRTISPSQIRSAIAWINHWEQPEQLRKQTGRATGRAVGILVCNCLNSTPRAKSSGRGARPI